MSDGYIPAKTLEVLAQEHPEGTRHHAKIVIALPLLGNGLPPSAVCATLREKFPAASEKEIADVVNWCAGRNPQPSGFGKPANATRFAPVHAAPSLKTPLDPATAQKHAALVVGDSVEPVEHITDASPREVTGDNLADLRALLEALYTAEERLSIVTKHTLDDKGKARPECAGKSMTRDEWLAWLDQHGIPKGKAGVWMRMNPVGQATGTNGGFTDNDVTRCAYALLESDWLDVETQLSLYMKLKLPVVAMIASGGKSVHAWVRIDAPDLATYRGIVKLLLDALQHLGFDQSNKNPSRFSRMPGAVREIGAAGDGVQRLIWLDPYCKPLTAEGVQAAAIIAEPMMDGLLTGEQLRARVKEFMRPKAPPFTLPIFEGRNGEGFYFRPQELTLWSGTSGHGKSTMLATVMLNLIAVEAPFFVCSLEHMPEQLCELIASIYHKGTVLAPEVDKFLEFVGHRFVAVDRVGSIAPTELLMMMRNAHRKMGVQHFFIDSLMRVDGLEEDYPAQTVFANALQAVAKETGGHVHLVAHPKKTDETLRLRKGDVKGNSSLANNADNVVAMRRNTQKDDMRDNGEMTPELEESMHDGEFSVVKQRITGWQGVIRLKFDWRTKVFSKFTGSYAKQKAVKQRRDWHKD